MKIVSVNFMPIERGVVVFLDGSACSIDTMNRNLFALIGFSCKIDIGSGPSAVILVLYISLDLKQ
jgi:hypothetical protein